MANNFLRVIKSDKKSDKKKTGGKHIVKKILSVIMWTAVTFAMIFVALCFFPYFNISEIEVNGTDSLTTAQVIELCNVKEGQNLFALNTIKAGKLLRLNNYVRSVTFKRELPQRLVINVSEYPVSGYVPYMDSYLYIDENGLVLDSRPTMAKQLPIVTGLHFDSFTIGEVLQTDNPQIYKSVKEMSNLFKRYELLGDVIKVDVSDSENIHLYIDKVDVKFGSFQNANDKIATLNAILKQMDTSVAGVLDLTVQNPTFKYMS